MCYNSVMADSKVTFGGSTEKFLGQKGIKAATDLFLKRRTETAAKVVNSFVPRIDVQTKK